MNVLDPTQDAIPVERGCGKRKPGGIYWTLGSSPWGSPIEHFLIDPPYLVTDENVSSLGMKFFQFPGDSTWHLLDIVGQEYYPNPADFIEETRRFGLSRRMSSKLDFSRLTADSRICLAHRKAWVTNLEAFHGAGVVWECPSTDLEVKALHEDAEALLSLPEYQGGEGVDGETSERMCAGIYWHNILEGESVSEDSLEVTRYMPSFSYQGCKAPATVKPEYELAIFLVFPLGSFVVIDDLDNPGIVESRFNAVSKSGLPVKILDD